MALLVIRNLFGQLRDEVRPLRTWSNEIHLAFQDVPELRDLVDANLANDAANARGAVVTFRRPDRSFLFRIDSHRAKLRQYERSAVSADTFLFVKHRSVRFEFDEDCGNGNDRQRK